MNSFSSDSSFTKSVSAVPVDQAHGGSVTIPDAHFLFHADFKRSGSDLTLTGDDGHRIVVPDYFKHERLPTLLSPEGAALAGDVVAALAGPLAPNQYAQASGQPGGPQPIGRIATVEGTAQAVLTGPQGRNQMQC